MNVSHSVLDSSNPPLLNSTPRSLLLLNPSEPLPHLFSRLMRQRISFFDSPVSFCLGLASSASSCLLCFETIYHCSADEGNVYVHLHASQVQEYHRRRFCACIPTLKRSSLRRPTPILAAFPRWFLCNRIGKSKPV